MARILVPTEDDWRTTHGVEGGRLQPVRITTVSIFLLAFIACGVLFQQYVFITLVVFFVASFALLMRYSLRVKTKARHLFNRFWCEELEVEFSDRVFKVTVGLNRLTLAATDIASLRELDPYYYLQHDCGLELLIPTKALSSEEITTLEKYRIQTDQRRKERGSKFLRTLMPKLYSTMEARRSAIREKQLGS
jgi:hypothetical protein